MNGVVKIKDKINLIKKVSSFTILGDPGCDGLGVEIMTTFSKAMNCTHTDFKIILGDLVPFGLEEFYKHIYGIINEISPNPVYTICGNHDTDYYIEYFGLEKQVDFKIENAEHLSFEDKSFDVIFSINTIHHLVNPFKVIDELIRIVTFEGKIILSDFSKEGLEIIDKVHASEGRTHPAGQSSLEDIENYLLQKGFKTEKHRTRFQKILIAYHPFI